MTGVTRGDYRADCGRIVAAGKGACDAHSRPNRYAFRRKAARLMMNVTYRGASSYSPPRSGVR